MSISTNKYAALSFVSASLSAGSRLDLESYLEGMSNHEEWTRGCAFAGKGLFDAACTIFWRTSMRFCGSGAQSRHSYTFGSRVWLGIWIFRQSAYNSPLQIGNMDAETINTKLPFYIMGALFAVILSLRLARAFGVWNGFAGSRIIQPPKHIKVKKRE
ncbi:hypothetical protein DFS34DRAFT_650842 [Phlyctochytrium arcticum]|nr:hypothetical protein DFS34DRAFT_650842 [Phlyctochytrium arcticum]